MNWNRLASKLLFSLGLLLLLVACDVPEIRLPGPAGADGPRSNFVPPRKSIRVRVGQVLPIESYHISQNKLGSLKIFVNGQPVRAEETGGQPAFPETLATNQVLVRGQPQRPDFTLLEFPSSKCETLLEKGGPVRVHTRQREFPSRTWIVCHIWIGHVPGTYDLSLEVADLAHPNWPGQRILQRIEVK